VSCFLDALVKICNGDVELGNGGVMETHQAMGSTSIYNGFWALRITALSWRVGSHILSHHPFSYLLIAPCQSHRDNPYDTIRSTGCSLEIPSSLTRWISHRQHTMSLVDMRPARPPHRPSSQHHMINNHSHIHAHPRQTVNYWQHLSATEQSIPNLRQHSIATTFLRRSAI
jgi:hypothetical protein